MCLKWYEPVCSDTRRMFEGNHPVFKNVQRCSRTNRPYPPGRTNGFNLLRQAAQPGIKPAFHTLPSSFLPFDPPFQAHLWVHTLVTPGTIGIARHCPNCSAPFSKRALLSGFCRDLSFICGDPLRFHPCRSLHAHQSGRTYVGRGKAAVPLLQSLS